MTRFLFLFWLSLFMALSPFLRCEEGRPQVFAHYMPWFSNKEISGSWGFHWTMNHFDPDIVKWNGRREAASHDYPLIGLYDSSDPDLLECHALLMKYTGLDGAVIDWYGTEDFFDYKALHENTRQMIRFLKKAGLKFAVCYEDQSIGAMVKGEHLKPEEAVPHGKKVLEWVEENWFSDDGYLESGGQPVLPVFGPQYFKPDQWSEVLGSIENPPLVYGLPHATEGPQLAWPPLDAGKQTPKSEWSPRLEAIYSDERGAMGVAFPGFHDIYAQAGLHESYGRIDSRDGKTLLDSLDLALKHRLPFIQIATWNDFGEGTQIEPTTSLGYRYLESIQEKMKAHHGFQSDDLRLPVELYQLKKRSPKNDELSKVAELLFSSKTGEARRELSRLKTEISKTPVEPHSKYRLVADLPYRESEDLNEYQRNRCALDLYYPAGGKRYSTVVWFHGGGITRGSKEIPTPLRNKGIAVAAVNYRMSPRVKEPEYIKDAAASVAWLFKNIHRYGAGTPGRIFVSGHSAGGYLASMIGLDRRYLAEFDIDADEIAGLIPFSGHTITHFTVRKERGIAGNRPIVDPLAPLYHVRKDCPPMLLITGDREMELWGRYEENAYFRRMMEVAGHQDVTLRELEGYGHGDMPEPAFPLLLEFIEQHLPKVDR